MVDGVRSRQNELGHGDQGIPVLNEGLQDGGQGLRGVLGGVVKQHDRPRPNLRRHPLGDLRS